MISTATSVKIQAIRCADAIDGLKVGGHSAVNIDLLFVSSCDGAVVGGRSGTAETEICR